MYHFKPVSLDDRPEFAEALSVLKRPSCECNFVSFFAWRDVYDNCFTRVEGRIIMLGRKVRCLLFPFGAWFEPQEMESIRREIEQAEGMPLFWGNVPQEYLDRHGDELRKIYDVACVEDEFDYIYDTEDLAAVAGNVHQNTRRLLRRFEDTFPEARMEPIMAADAAMLATRLAGGGETHYVMPKDEAPDEDALERALSNFAALELDGARLVDGAGRLLAFSLWSFTTSEVANVHFEKAARKASGAAQTIRIGVARKLVGRARWINLEQDLGVPGLRQSKQSYNPHHLLTSCRLVPRQEGGGA